MRPLSSIGVRGKLIGLLVGTAFAALLLACAAFVYYDRASYSEAKQTSAEVLAASVAQSAYGPTAFGDPESSGVILKVLASEPTAIAGAIYGQDGKQLAAWTRSAGMQLRPAYTYLPVGYAGHELRVARPIANAEGAVGMLEVVFSTTDIDARTQRFLLLAGGVLAVAVLIALGLAFLGQRFVTRPVAILAAAARRVQEHQDLDVRAERVSGDELGQLTDAFNTMLAMIQTRDRELEGHRQNLEALVAQRTADLDRRNGQMRLVLDHVDQGFITVDLHGEMASERSAIVDRWFTVGDTTSFGALAGAGDPAFATWFELGLEGLRDGMMPPELVLHQMPHRLTAGDRTFAIEYTPIGDGTRLLLIINDVTELLAHERAQREQAELVTFFQRVTTDRDGVEDFFRESAALVAALRTEPDRAIQNRLIHTLKGNSAMFGLDSFAARLHELETALADADDLSRARLLAEIPERWKAEIVRFGVLLGGTGRKMIEVDRAELASASADSGATADQLRARLASWFLDPMQRRFERLAEQAEVLAQRLERPVPTFLLRANGLRLAGTWGPFWSAMVHAVRNALDHGIEPPDARRAAHKSPAGTLELVATRTDGRIHISLRDDGRGIDWDAVRRKATAAGLPAATHDDLVEALFADGMSTRDSASAVSGRGVGMSALRQAVRELGGAIAIESTRGEGTTLHFTFDERTVARTKPSRAQRTSLLPVLAS